MKNNTHTKKAPFASSALLCGKIFTENPTEHKLSVLSVRFVIKHLLFIALCSSVIVLPAFSQTKKIQTLPPSQLNAINWQIIEQRRQNAAAPQARHLRQQVKTATEDYQKVVDNLPGIKEIDQQIAELRQQVFQLQKRKIELIQKHKARLKPLKAKIDAASVNLRKTIAETPQLKALRAEQRRLIKQTEKKVKHKILPAKKRPETIAKKQ